MEISKIYDITPTISNRKQNIGTTLSSFNSQLEAVKNSFLQSNSNDTLSEEVKSALATIELKIKQMILEIGYKNKK